MTFICVVICLIIWGICGCIVYFVFDAFFGENKIIDVGMGILTYSVMTLLLAMIFKKVPFISNAMLVEVWVRGAHISGFDFMIFGPAAYAE